MVGFVTQNTQQCSAVAFSPWNVQFQHQRMRLRSTILRHQKRFSVLQSNSGNHCRYVAACLFRFKCSKSTLILLVIAIQEKRTHACDTRYRNKHNIAYIIYALNVWMSTKHTYVRMNSYFEYALKRNQSFIIFGASETKAKHISKWK